VTGCERGREPRPTHGPLYRVTGLAAGNVTSDGDLVRRPPLERLSLGHHALEGHPAGDRHVAIPGDTFRENVLREAEHHAQESIRRVVPVDDPFRSPDRRALWIELSLNDVGDAVLPVGAAGGPGFRARPGLERLAVEIRDGN